jgi:hypothetical protein
VSERPAIRPAPAADRPWTELSDQDRCRVLDWIVDTVLLFGGQRTTAYAVAAEFARGLDPEPPPRPTLRREPILPRSARMALGQLRSPAGGRAKAKHDW